MTNNKENILNKIKNIRLEISKCTQSTEIFLKEHEIYRLHQLLGYILEKENNNETIEDLKINI